MKNFELIVTDEIKALYNRYGQIDVVFNVKSVSNLRYRAFGLAAPWSPERAKEWNQYVSRTNSKHVRRITGGAEGCFQYELHGHIRYPEKWKNFECVLDVNPWTDKDVDSFYIKGFLGEGSVHFKYDHFTENRIHLNIYVKPDISRGILEKIYIFNKVQAIFSYLRDKNLSTSKFWRFIEFFLCWNQVEAAIKSEETSVSLHIANAGIWEHVDEGETPILRGNESINFDIIRLFC